MAHLSFSDARPKRCGALAVTISMIAILTAAVLPTATAGASGGGWRVVASGLDNPRGIDPGPLGSLVVAEAGRGGTDCQPGIDPESGEPVTNCLGNTGAVDLLWGGHKFKLASLPSIAQSVPTSITQGPDHAWYVGELTGFPFQEGLARVWRIVPGHAPTVYASGFTNIIDLQFDRHGNLFVLELARHGLLAANGPGGDPNGALIEIDPNGNRTTVASDGLVLPGGVAVDANDHIYVTTFSIMAGAGQVVRIR